MEPLTIVYIVGSAIGAVGGVFGIVGCIKTSYKSREEHEKTTSYKTSKEEIIEDAYGNKSSRKSSSEYNGSGHDIVTHEEKTTEASRKNGEEDGKSNLMTALTGGAGVLAEGAASLVGNIKDTLTNKKSKKLENSSESTVTIKESKSELPLPKSNNNTMGIKESRPELPSQTSPVRDVTDIPSIFHSREEDFFKDSWTPRPKSDQRKLLKAVNGQENQRLGSSKQINTQNNTNNEEISKNPNDTSTQSVFGNIKNFFSPRRKDNPEEKSLLLPNDNKAVSFAPNSSAESAANTPREEGIQPKIEEVQISKKQKTVKIQISGKEGLSKSKDNKTQIEKNLPSTFCEDERNSDSCEVISPRVISNHTHTKKEERKVEENAPNTSSANPKKLVNKHLLSIKTNSAEENDRAIQINNLPVVNNLPTVDSIAQHESTPTQKYDTPMLGEAEGC